MHPDKRQFLAAKKELRSTKLQSSFLFYVCHQILNTEISFLRPSIFSSSTLAVLLSFSTCSSNLLATSLTVSALHAVSSMISEIFFTAATAALRSPSAFSVLAAISFNPSISCPMRACISRNTAITSSTALV